MYTVALYFKLSEDVCSMCVSVHLMSVNPVFILLPLAVKCSTMFISLSVTGAAQVVYSGSLQLFH